jgi:hypothetical protein
MCDHLVASRDLKLTQIQQEIINKKKLLIQKKKDLENKLVLNEFLADVKNDYAKYHKHILHEKEQQRDTLMLLNEYINDLISTEHLVDDQLRIAKHDQKDIITEIDRVKAELDEIVEYK